MQHLSEAALGKAWPVQPFQVLAADSLALPSAPVLGAGWRAEQAVFADGLTVLELLHDSGSASEWYFDREGHFSNGMDAWPADTQAAPLAALRPAVQSLLDTCLAAGAPLPDGPLTEFARIGPAFRATLAGLLQPSLLPEPRHHVIGAPGTVTPRWADADALSQTLSVNLQDRFASALRDEALTWPSPVDGVEMPCTGSITLGDFAMLFRFRAEPADCSVSGFDVFLIATEHMSRVAGLYVPEHGLLITGGGDQARIGRDILPQFAYHLLRHLAAFADSLLAGCAQAPKPFRFATFLRPHGSAHLGHHLWNELTGIETLVAVLPPNRLPEWLIPGLPGNGIEFYGPIDALFPEIAGRVRRGFADQRAVVAHAYEQRLVLFRATREYVGGGLRRRVTDHAVRSVPALPPISRAILIGLRVENRTATDLEALCALIIEEALRWHVGGTSPGGKPPLTVVFDGHNARGSTRSDETISSHREGGSGLSPLAAERAVVAAMRRRFANQPVTLLDTLGEPLAVSLAWAQASDAFVALWGAGLAKYRWVANKPGLVTSRWNLENKGDLHIYDAAAYMADPTPMAYVRNDVVRDLPNAPMLVPFEDPTYHNFTFDPDAMRDQIHAFLTALHGPPETLAALAQRPGQRHGCVDLVDFAVRGWAIWDGENSLVLDIVIDGALVGRAACDMPRPDLLAAGFGTATAGFGFVIPPAFLDGTPRLLTVRYADGVGLPMLSPNTPDPFAFHLGGALPVPG